MQQIDDLKADVDTNGGIKVKGRGLRLAGGDSIGQSLNLSVIATLTCGTAAPFAQFSTGAVTLDANGDFQIDDLLTPAVPSECASPALLIRGTTGSGRWLAAGIPKVKDEE